MRTLALGYVSVVVLNLIGFVVAATVQWELRGGQEELVEATMPERAVLRTLAGQAGVLSSHAQDIFLAQEAVQFLDLEPRVQRTLDTIRAVADELVHSSERIDAYLTSAIREVGRALALQRSLSHSRGLLEAEVEAVTDQLGVLRFQIFEDAYNSKVPGAWDQTTAIIAGWNVRLLNLRDAPPARAIEGIRQSLLADFRIVAQQLSMPGSATFSAAGASMLKEVIERIYADEGPVGLALAIDTQRSETLEALRAAQTNTQALGKLLESELSRVDTATAVRAQHMLDLSGQLQSLLIGLAVVSVLLGAVLIYRSVYRGVALPLQEIAQRTLALAEGQEVPVLRNKYREFDQIERGLAVFRDNARALADARQELEEKNTSLERTVEDLDRFAYAASHDLRSPLRAIKTLASFLEEDLEEVLDPAARHNLQRIQHRIVGLEDMLENLLAYARTTVIDSTREDVDLQQCISEQLLMLNHSDQVKLEFCGTPATVFAPRAPVAQIFRNLLDNAIKHHPALNDRIDSSEPQPVHVTVETTCDEAGIKVRVSDNGDGVPEEYLERVQKLFETMQPKSQQAGSGFGLALVTKLASQIGASLHLSKSTHGGLCAEICWSHS